MRFQGDRSNSELPVFGLRILRRPPKLPFRCFESVDIGFALPESRVRT